MKKLLSSVLLVLSYVWVMAFDMLIMLSVFSTVSRVVLATGATDQVSFIAGMATATLTFAHLKFRHRLRQMGKATKVQVTAECEYCNDSATKEINV